MDDDDDDDEVKDQNQILIKLSTVVNASDVDM